MEAGCSLADSCPPGDFRRFKARYPDHLVLSYINCSAEIKALSDIIVTSANAERIVRSLPPEQKLIFAPDRNLGRFLMERIGREMVLWDGACEVHEQFDEEELVKLKLTYPGARVIAHPECTRSLLQHADFVGSTSALLRYSRESDAEKFIVVTEPGVIHQMSLQSPGKLFIAAPGGEADDECACNECPYMRLNTLEKILHALQKLEPRIEMDAELLERARRPLERMLELS
jgi:quinolinate synthase